MSHNSPQVMDVGLNHSKIPQLYTIPGQGIPKGRALIF